MPQRSCLFFDYSSAQGLDFSFRGTFEADDDVQLFNFTVESTSTVTLKTLSYAGGTQADNTVISAGGFDPILSLFDGSRNFIEGNDDGTYPYVAVDPVTGQTFDTFFQETLFAGNYTVAISQYDNFFSGGIGDNISLGFLRSGQPNFTSLFCNGNFCDITGDIRTNQWAFDILNVNQANQQEVPEPLTILGSLTALLFGGLFKKKLFSHNKYLLYSYSFINHTLF